MTDRLRGVLEWLTAGYPAGIPSTDFIPVLALLRRRLTQDEVSQIAAEVAALTRTGAPAEPGAVTADIGVGVTRVTDELPSAADIARVQAHLSRRHGWPDDETS
ncbi:MAG: DUF3349 domain-containing protein [Actinomycetota bacterium]|nr:DUF3349 domain-containing protein [Actinomycetota bacterium]